MRRRRFALVALALVLAVAAFVVFKGSLTARLVFLAAAFAVIAAINVWLWARCRSWPEVNAVLETGDSVNGRAEPHLVYTYADGTYARPAQISGTSGSFVALKVDPSEPSRSSLVLPRPDGWIAVLALASCVLVGALIHTVAV